MAPPAVNNPTGGGWNPSGTANGQTPEGSMYREGAVQPTRSLNDGPPPASLAHAATNAPAGPGLPGEENLQPLAQMQGMPVAQPLRDSRGVTGVQPVSYQVPADNPNQVSHSVYAREQAAAAPPSQYRPGSTAPVAAPTTGRGPVDQGATYGFDGNYAWLHGQLEYSEATKVWKLRYVPLNGPADRFGGVVVLADSDLLVGHKAGEFVAVKGQIDGRPGPQGSFAPLYRVSEVQRLSE